MKIGIFTDSHYSSAETSCFGIRFNSQSLRKIEEAFTNFKKEKCDLIVSLGDLIDKEDSHEKETENSKKVKIVFQGHYHKGNAVEQNNVKYITLPAMCEGEERYYIFEI